MIHFGEGNLIHVPRCLQASLLRYAFTDQAFAFKIFSFSRDFIPLIGLILERKKKKDDYKAHKFFSLHKV